VEPAGADERIRGEQLSRLVERTIEDAQAAKRLVILVAERPVKNETVERGKVGQVLLLEPVELRLG
jgi:hypothetical protein